jgi:hypothetical protein
MRYFRRVTHSQIFCNLDMEQTTSWYGNSCSSTNEFFSKCIPRVRYCVHSYPHSIRFLYSLHSPYSALVTWKKGSVFFAKRVCNGAPIDFTMSLCTCLSVGLSFCLSEVFILFAILHTSFLFVPRNSGFWFLLARFQEIQTSKFDHPKV